MVPDEFDEHDHWKQGAKYTVSSSWNVWRGPPSEVVQGLPPSEVVQDLPPSEVMKSQ
jgi:hypothetical protein